MKEKMMGTINFIKRYPKRILFITVLFAGIVTGKVMKLVEKRRR